MILSPYKISESFVLKKLKSISNGSLTLNNHDGKFHESPSVKEGIISDMLQELINRDFILNSTSISGKWCEIDTLEDLNESRKIFQ